MTKQRDAFPQITTDQLDNESSEILKHWKRQADYLAISHADDASIQQLIADTFPAGDCELTPDEVRAAFGLLGLGLSIDKAYDVIEEVERVAAMIATHECGEGPREFVPWLDDEIVSNPEWLAEHGDRNDK